MGALLRDLVTVGVVALSIKTTQVAGGVLREETPPRESERFARVSGSTVVPKADQVEAHISSDGDIFLSEEDASIVNRKPRNSGPRRRGKGQSDALGGSAYSFFNSGSKGAGNGRQGKGRASNVVQLPVYYGTATDASDYGYGIFTFLKGLADLASYDYAYHTSAGGFDGLGSSDETTSDSTAGSPFSITIHFGNDSSSDANTATGKGRSGDSAGLGLGWASSDYY